MKQVIFCILAFLCVQYTQAQVATRTLFDPKTIGEIRLTFAKSNWSDALDSMRVYGKDLLDAEVKIDGIDYAGVGARFRGNSSYQFGMKRNPFHIKLNHTNKEQNHQGNKTIKLSSALRDPSMVREMLFLEIANQYLPSPKAAFVKLFVNNQYAGVYILIESIDEKFLTEQYGPNRTPHLYKAGVDHPAKVKPTGCLENIAASLEHEQNMECLAHNFEIETSGDNFVPLHSLTYALHNDPKATKQLLNVDRTLWMLALNNVMVNLSSYQGKTSANYYLYQDAQGKFQPIFWDLNLAFGSLKNIGTGSDLELKDLQRIEPMLHASNQYKPLVSKLLADPLNKKIYLAHIRQILEDNFYNGLYERRARELQAMIVVPFADDINKPYTLDQFQTSLTTTIGKKTKIPGIVELMSKRIKFLKSHPEMTSLPSVISEIEFAGREKFDNKTVNAFKISLKGDKYPKRAILYYRFDNKGEFTALTLNDGPQVSNHGSGVRAFEGVVPSPSDSAQMQYYILVENTGTITYSPANYTQKTHQILLSEINK